MTPKQKLGLARKIILAAWTITLLLHLFEGAISMFVPNRYPNIEEEPWFIAIATFCLLLMIVGVRIGSLGIGTPLNVRAFFSLVFGFPCWILAATHLLIDFVMIMIIEFS